MIFHFNWVMFRFYVNLQGCSDILIIPTLWLVVRWMVVMFGTGIPLFLGMFPASQLEGSLRNIVTECHGISIQTNHNKQAFLAWCRLSCSNILRGHYMALQYILPPYIITSLTGKRVKLISYQWLGVAAGIPSVPKRSSAS